MARTIRTTKLGVNLKSWEIERLKKQAKAENNRDRQGLTAKRIKSAMLDGIGLGKSNTSQDDGYGLGKEGYGLGNKEGWDGKGFGTDTNLTYAT